MADDLLCRARAVLAEYAKPGGPPHPRPHITATVGDLVAEVTALRDALWEWRDAAYRLGGEVPGTRMNEFWEQYMYPPWRTANRLLGTWTRARRDGAPAPRAPDANQVIAAAAEAAQAAGQSPQRPGHPEGGERGGR